MAVSLLRLTPIVLTASLLLSACGKSLVKVSYSSPADIHLEPGDKIGILVTSYIHCQSYKGESCAPPPADADAQQEFAGCLARAMLREKPALPIAPQRPLFELMHTLADKPSLALTALEARLRQEKVRAALLAEGYSYLVAASVLTDEPNRHTIIKVDDPRGGWSIRRLGTKTTHFTAVVASVRQGKVLTTLSTTMSGDKGILFPVFVVIPLPPVPFTTPTESPSCALMGKHLAYQFLVPREEETAP